MDLSSILRDQAQFTLNSGGDIEVQSALCYVSITWPSGDCFLQGDEASDFIAQIDKLYEETGDMDENTIALALAWPYIENLSD